jgi:hypothetical protein
MQRRAAAIFAAFFLLVGAGSYTLIATAQQPHVEFDDPAYELKQNDTVEAGGEQYNVSEISASTGGEGGGHGGGGGGEITRSATITYANESARYTATWENNSTVVLGEENTTYRVDIENGTDVSSFVLREQINESRILANDPRADNQTITRNGSRYVVLEDESGNATLVPANEYFPEPNTREFQVGQTFRNQSNQTTIANVTNSSAKLVWTAPRTNSIEVASHENVTLGDQKYLAHFPNNSTLQLTQDFEGLQAQNERIDQFTLNKNGLWGVFIVSVAGAIFVLMLAFLPSRY